MIPRIVAQYTKILELFLRENLWGIQRGLANIRRAISFIYCALICLTHLCFLFSGGCYCRAYSWIYHRLCFLFLGRALTGDFSSQKVIGDLKILARRCWYVQSHVLFWIVVLVLALFFLLIIFFFFTLFYIIFVDFFRFLGLIPIFIVLIIFLFSVWFNYQVTFRFFRAVGSFRNASFSQIVDSFLRWFLNRNSSFVDWFLAIVWCGSLTCFILYDAVH